MILEQVEEQDIGIQLVNITIQDSEPPTQEVMKAFKAVEDCQAGKRNALNNANKYRNEKLPEAQAQADQIVQDAQAQKQVRINEAEAEVARFNAMYEEYVKNPQTTKIRMFYETMEEVLPEMKIIIDNGDGVQKILPVDSFACREYAGYGYPEYRYRKVKEIQNLYIEAKGTDSLCVISPYRKNEGDYYEDEKYCCNNRNRSCGAGWCIGDGNPAE